MASIEPIPNEFTKIIPPPQHSSDPEQVKADTEEHKDLAEDSGRIFQAVGVITGKVNFINENQSTVIIGRKEYPLFYIPRKQRAFEAL